MTYTLRFRADAMHRCICTATSEAAATVNALSSLGRPPRDLNKPLAT